MNNGGAKLVPLVSAALGYPLSTGILLALNVFWFGIYDSDLLPAPVAFLLALLINLLCFLPVFFLQLWILTKTHGGPRKIWSIAVLSHAIIEVSICASYLLDLGIVALMSAQALVAVLLVATMLAIDEIPK